jgi:hypothetical protein
MTYIRRSVELSTNDGGTLTVTTDGSDHITVKAVLGDTTRLRLVVNAADWPAIEQTLNSVNGEQA